MSERERPTDRQLNHLSSGRLRQRQVDELIGIAKGITADDILTDAELSMLVHWLVANREITYDPIVASLYRRVETMLADGHFDDEERAELLSILKDFGSHSIEAGEVMRSTALPFTEPLPLLGFAGWRYCFTGAFNYGTRAQCEAAVVERGAVAGTLTKQTDTLVVGVYGTESWLHSAYGLKVIKAAGMRDGGHHITIVSETHWVTYL